MNENDLRSSIRAWRDSCYEYNLNILYAMSFDPDVRDLLRTLSVRPRRILARVPTHERFSSKQSVISFLKRVGGGEK